MCRDSSPPFTLVFADPPYAAVDADVDTMLQSLAASRQLAPGATVVVERPAGAVVDAPPELADEWERTYGDTLVLFLVRDLELDHPGQRYF